MHFTSTQIQDVILIDPDVFEDERGFFWESWQRKKFAEAGIDYDFVQDNYSQSVRGVLRGLHYQIRQPQGKLMRVTMGEVFDVAVDIRESSPVFGLWVGEYLTAESKRMLWIPPGFAHGFYVVSERAEFQYKCTDYYAPDHERCIRWDDPTIGINWPIPSGASPIVSAKDQSGLELPQAELFR